MIAAVSTCDTSNWFNFVCNSIQSNDQSGLVGPFVEHLISAIAIFIVIYLLGRLTRVVVLWAMGRTKADRQVRTLVRNLITVTTYVVAVITALVVYGVNVAVILTAAGIGTVAVGLAFQDLLRNVLAGIWLLLEQPFRLGDVITVLDQTGAVQNITLRTTTLRTGVGELAILPNLTVFTGIVINSSHYDTRRLSVVVRLPVGADIADVMRRARQAVEQVPGIDEKPGMLFEPILEGEVPLLKCSFWVDQREQDPDAMTAAVAEQLWELVGTRPKRAKQASESSA
ncbi:MAG: small conductance mechanosensitive channel [Chloroflexota bacterium]|nr:small conductance mechanosensitive channel [Chloroflexota bacterium]